MDVKRKYRLKRKSLFGALPLLILLVIFGMTTAYFRSDYTSTNQIVGTGDGMKLKDTFESPNGWIPGQSINTDFRVFNTNDSNIAVRASITEVWTSKSGTTLNNTLTNSESVVLKSLGTNWTYNNGYYYYTEEVSNNNETESLFTTLTFNKNATIDLECTTNSETSSEDCTSSGGYGSATYHMTINYEIVDASQASTVWSYNPFGNSFIKAAYTYNESTCQTGNESGCVATTCYQSGTCPVGTIIDYQVDSSTTNNTNANDVTSGIMRFHVLADDGTTMTLQSQRNVVKGVAWYSASNSNSSGPTTILASLESATSGWSNVNTLSYNLNNTGTNALGSTLCSSYNSCTGNAYTMSKSNVKARLITMQEATNSSIGHCTTSGGSCAKFMSNYLYNHSTHNNTYYDSTNGNYGYWTSSASSDSRYAWIVYFTGYVYSSNTTYTDYGARAVIEINK